MPTSANTDGVGESKAKSSWTTERNAAKLEAQFEWILWWENDWLTQRNSGDLWIAEPSSSILLLNLTHCDDAKKPLPAN